MKTQLTLKHLLQGAKVLQTKHKLPAKGEIIVEERCYGKRGGGDRGRRGIFSEGRLGESLPFQPMHTNMFGLPSIWIGRCCVLGDIHPGCFFQLLLPPPCNHGWGAATTEGDPIIGASVHDKEWPSMRSGLLAGRVATNGPVLSLLLYSKCCCLSVVCVLFHSNCKGSTINPAIDFNQTWL